MALTSAMKPSFGRWPMPARQHGCRRGRIKLIAQDIVDHFELRAEAMLRQTQDEGKAMIVCMSRRICVELYREIIKLRPNWHDEGDGKGVMKVIMTGSASDPVDLADAYSQQDEARRACQTVSQSR